MSKKENDIKPIKRHEALVSYSREHHNGLLLVWKIRTGHKKGVEPIRIAAYVVFCFETELKLHFQDEEAFLGPKLPRGHPYLERLVNDHKTIRELMCEIDADPMSGELQQNFADQLEQHIRFEERQLFNYLQEHLSGEELRELSELERKAPVCAPFQWDDPFWM